MTAGKLSTVDGLCGLCPRYRPPRRIRTTGPEEPRRSNVIGQMTRCLVQYYENGFTLFKDWPQGVRFDRVVKDRKDCADAGGCEGRQDRFCSITRNDRNA